MIIDTLYEAYSNGRIYHSHLSLANIVIEKKESNKKEEDVDPMNKNVKKNYKKK